VTRSTTIPPFDAFEIAGWKGRSEAYLEHIDPLTEHAVETLLALLGVGVGDSLLDVGCGPGTLAARAAARGAAVTGCDIAEDMVELARRLHPELTVDVADAAALPYLDGAFDAAVLASLVQHTARAEEMVAEAVRVVRPGGRVVVSAYATPDKARFVGVFGAASARVPLTPPADVPPGPHMFVYADHAALDGLLASAGLADRRVTEFAFTHRVASAAALLEALGRGTVRAAALLDAQTPETLAALEAAIAEELEPYRSPDGGHEVPVAFTLATGIRPFDPLIQESP
jgi:2-polyprenyl-3-methyl-5-hydroxy-6-metoxy-1,4-benzoquinol methylase